MSDHTRLHEDLEKALAEVDRYREALEQIANGEFWRALTWEDPDPYAHDWR